LNSPLLFLYNRTRRLIVPARAPTHVLPTKEELVGKAEGNVFFA
jgi:hypothetical protein